MSDAIQTSVFALRRALPVLGNCVALPAGEGTHELPSRRFTAHLEQWLGEWRGDGEVTFATTGVRDQPRWDGGRWPLLGVAGPRGGVVSLSPELDRAPLPAGFADWLRTHAIQAESPVGGKALLIERTVLRWTLHPTMPGELGEWASTDDPRVPDWPRPFSGDVLIAWDDEGRYAAGVGRKRHNAFAQEISVGTEPHHRGKGLAVKLVAQAARRILAEGAIPLYLHLTDNHASARVAEKAGFPDLGWRCVWIE